MLNLLGAVLLLAAAKPNGQIDVKTLTAGAKIYLDDKPVGTAPTVLKNVVAGEHKVKLKKLGYLAGEEIVRVEPGKTVSVSVDLLPYAGILVVKAGPKSAQVFVDGKGIGVTPFEGEINIGRRAVEVRKDGYAPYREMFQVGAGETYRIETTLQKLEQQQEGDVPLVAIAPKRSKKLNNDNDDDMMAIPLAAPTPVTPTRANDALPMYTTANFDAPQPWYKKWWVWTIAGVVVAGAIAVPVAMSQAGPGVPTADFNWTLGAR